MERRTGGILYNTTATSRPGGCVSPPSHQWWGDIQKGGSPAPGIRPNEVGKGDAFNDARQDDLRKRYLVPGGPPYHILEPCIFSPYPTTCHATLPIQDHLSYERCLLLAIRQ